MPQGLGRGLSSLIPKKINNTYSDFNVKDNNGLEISDRSRIIYINPSEIIANPYQPRRDFSDKALEDLMKSIKEHGIIQPLVVTKIDTGYELIAGERRWRSAKALSLKEVPVIVREANKQKKLELALIENLQRENLNPVETAIAYNQLINEFNLTQEDASVRVGKSRSAVANSLRLLQLPAEVQLALIEKKITEAHAKYLLGLESPAKQLSVFKKILHQGLSVRDTDQLIKNLGGTKSALVKSDYRDKTRSEKLSHFFGAKVEIKRQKQGGQIIINFAGDEDLDEIIRKI
ncbi:chromosome partitioning protein ParB [Candidatus Falkowbacteria bacterium CG10_big_fil_rev_8_21_14_0_10_39_9]|uniref:Chromosome partitioning protein ParB n=1 Tax=Candidatus Falkowbacteria bacterium CG10_big_fil_rev_8_21_14_0_10_39_9 TaxID=1974566 RepID=A0A2M6WR44_9BACT|nr:MAG: chromosome partitioning protein ParB [Candidatus Falkowbacteria bacterium CG10_big_fil_rev_8_21_14_0_10_39_9]